MSKVNELVWVHTLGKVDDELGPLISDEVWCQVDDQVRCEIGSYLWGIWEFVLDEVIDDYEW